MWGIRLSSAATVTAISMEPSCGHAIARGVALGTPEYIVLCLGDSWRTDGEIVRRSVLVTAIQQLHRLDAKR